jgi:hypothetical protein
MCYLVTAGAREGRTQVEAFLGVDSPLALRTSKNPSLRLVFPRADRLFDVTHGVCSCDLVKPRKRRPAAAQHPRLHAQYDRKGWSEAKIARALADRKAARDRQLKRGTEPARDLIKLLQILAARPGGVRVVVHFYSGSFESEAIQLAGATSLSIERLEIGAIGEDTLTDIVPVAAIRPQSAWRSVR